MNKKNIRMNILADINSINNNRKSNNCSNSINCNNNRQRITKSHIFAALVLSLLICMGMAVSANASTPDDSYISNEIHDPNHLENPNIFPGNVKIEPGDISNLMNGSDPSGTNGKIITELPVGCLHESTRIEYENEEAATCLKNGKYDEVVYCNKCDTQLQRETYTIEASVEFHNMSVILATAATCETSGNIEYYICGECGGWFLPDFSAVEDHNDVILPAMHKWGEWSITTYPTCTVNGQKTKICQNDPAHIEHEEILASHSESERTETVPASCETDGAVYLVKYCTTCSEEISRTQTDTLKASGHTPVKAVKEYIKEADSVNNGSYYEVVYCEKCKTELERITKIIPAPEKPQQNPPEDSMPLLTTDWTVDAEPTCEQNGLRSRYLNNEKKEEEILALGHNWDEWTVIKSPSYNLPGKKQRVCKHDKTHIEIQSIAPLTLDEYLQKIFDDKLSFQYPSTNNTTSIPYGGYNPFESQGSEENPNAIHNPTTPKPYGGYNPFESQGSEGNPNAIHNPDASQIQAGNKPGTIKATKESPGFTAKRSDRLNEDILSVRPHKLEISSGEDSIDLLYYLFGEDVKLRTIVQYYDYLRFIKGLMLDPYPPRPQNTIMIKVAEMTQEILKKHPTAHSAKYRINIGSENAGTKYTIYHVDSQSDSLISAGTVTASSDGEVAIDATKHDGMMMFLIPDYVSKFESHFYKDSLVPDNFISKPPRLPRLGGGRMFIPNIC